MTKRRRMRDVMLSAVSDTKHGEAETAILLTLNVFLLLLAYYLLKVAREPLILVGGGGAEVKSYSSSGQAVLLIFLTYAYGALASRVNRVKLIVSVTLFFAANLVIFSLLASQEVRVGIPFFLWVGIFNMMAVAQFWGFAADIYDEERGKRMFPILGIGSSAGALVATLIGREAERFPPPVLMLMAAGLLVVCVVLTVIVDRVETRRAEEEIRPVSKDPNPPPPPRMSDASGWKLLFSDRYLLLIALLMLAINWVNTNGEYVLDRVLLQATPEGAGRDEAIQTFKSNLFFWVNLVTLILQTVVVARVIKYLGVRRALFIIPIVSLISYGTLSFIPLLGFIFVAKVAENSLDYSLQNTARHALWLVTTREAKYKVKQVVDSFFVRIGDVASSGVVAAGVAIGFGTRGFVATNAVLVLAWLTVLVFLAREHKKRAREGAAR
jgi:AAA family ATP:ADP antiporter